MDDCDQKNGMDGCDVILL